MEFSTEPRFRKRPELTEAVVAEASDTIIMLSAIQKIPPLLKEETTTDARHARALAPRNHRT